MAFFITSNSANGNICRVLTSAAAGLSSYSGRVGVVGLAAAHRSDRSSRDQPRPVQLWTIGYLAKIASICLKALSAAASGVIPLRMMSAQAVLQTWVF